MFLEILLLADLSERTGSHIRSLKLPHRERLRFPSTMILTRLSGLLRAYP